MKFERRILPSTMTTPASVLVPGPRIVNPDGSVIFEAKDVMVPSSWSQVAVDVLAQKYFRKAGVPTATSPVPEENVPEWLWRSIPDEAALNEVSRNDQFRAGNGRWQVFERLAGCWTYWGWKNGYFDSEATPRSIPTRCGPCWAQIGAPDSPQWFNTGLHWAYGIAGPSQGHFYVDPANGNTKRSTTPTNIRKCRHAISYRSRTTG